MGIVGKSVTFALVLLFLIWCASVAFKGLGPGADVVVQELIDEDADVSELDGFVRKGDGYDVHIRFQAEQDFIEGLPYRGFTKAECSSARLQINFSWMRLAAWPLWRPEDLAEVVCFRRFSENAWSPNGRDYILAEVGGGWVYFSGAGREHDRALPDEGDKYQ